MIKAILIAQLQLRTYLIVLSLWMLICTACSSTTAYRNYYTVREGSEGDFDILKMSLRKDPYEIKDTIFCLTSVLGYVGYEERSNNADLWKVFARYPSHPIPLKETHYSRDSLYFSTDWLPFDGDRMMFEFRGKPFFDSIRGSLISSWFDNWIDEIHVDTTNVTFILSLKRYKTPTQPPYVFYQSGIVLTDSTPLQHGNMILKGDTVKINVEKSTGEGVYVKTKSDSGTIYFLDIELLFWVKERSKGIDLETGNVIPLSSDQPFILDSLRSGFAYISDNKRAVKVAEEFLVRDNKEFFEKHTK